MQILRPRDVVHAEQIILSTARSSTSQLISHWILSPQNLFTINSTASSLSDYTLDHGSCAACTYLSTRQHETKYHCRSTRSQIAAESKAYLLLSRFRSIRISLSKPSKIDQLYLISNISTREMPFLQSRPTLHATRRSRRSRSSKFHRMGLPRMPCIRC